MSDEYLGLSPLVDRVASLAELFRAGGLSRLRIERGDDVVELRKSSVQEVPSRPAAPPQEPAAVERDRITADLVGIFRMGRPQPQVGETLVADRELGAIEALGIRTPVRSLGPGKIVAIAVADGQPVEYGQTLFEIERG
jgi:acetyl-CoA carboxylase biotin carboxyl carrier protein